MKLLTSLLIAISLISIGCAKEKNSTAPAPKDEQQAPDGTDPGPFVPDGSGPGVGPGEFDGFSFESGGTADFTVEGSNQADKDFNLSEYAGTTINNHQNFRLNVNLVEHGNGYKGTVTTAYEEGGFVNFWHFWTGDTEQAVQLNVWFDHNGQPVFHAVLEDLQYGAVVVVIDQIVDLGDGNGPEDIVGGSLWFKNYDTNGWTAPHPYGYSGTHCWEVVFRKGETPFDCRPWPSGDYNNTYASPDPTKQDDDPFKGYKKLGTFEGLSIEEAFNGDFNF